MDYSSKIASAEKIKKALDFDGDNEQDDTEGQDNGQDLIKDFMQKNGLKTTEELIAYLAESEQIIELQDDGDFHIM